MDPATQAIASMDGNRPVPSIQGLIRAVRRPFIEIGAYGDQITASHDNGPNHPALEALAHPSA
jgi:hypothetical protein